MNWYKKAITEQEITSKDTSTNIIPSVFKKIKLKPGTINFDLGGGKFDTTTNYLKNLNINNIVYDPYNRSEEHNKNVLELIERNKPDTVTCANVLNVISNIEHRENVIKKAANYIKEDGIVYFQIYEGNKSGIGKKTIKGWQNNQKTNFYISEIQKYFRKISKVRNIIIAKGPIR